LKLCKTENSSSRDCFPGDENKATEEIILSKTGIKCIGRIEQEPYFDQNVIKEYADLFRENLLNLYYE
jgi:dethiobiotin synthetase